MLILTRTVGQSIQVGSDMLVTHAGIMEGRAVSLEIRRGPVKKTIVLALGETWRLTDEVAVTNSRCPKNRVNKTVLKFDAPESIGIYRTEVVGAKRRYERA